MSLIEEDGSGKSTAESYCTVAFATTYFTARAVTTWAALATDALREAALRKATEYMESNYRAQWQGSRKTEEQALSWPRYGVTVEGYAVSDESVPTAVQRACAELALRASTADLSPDMTQGVLREKVGPIEVTYDQTSPQKTRYAAIDLILDPYFAGRSSTVLMRVERV